MSKNLFEKTADIVLEQMEKAAGRVGTVSACATIAVLGFGSGVLPMAVSAALALGTFGVCGALESFHFQRNAQLQQRRRNLGVNSLLHKATARYAAKDIRIFEHFSHRGFRFNAVGVSQIPVPLGVSHPLCPQCGKSIGLEDAFCRFPGRIQITLHCICGYSVVSQRTLAELVAEAAALAGVPAD